MSLINIATLEILSLITMKLAKRSTINATARLTTSSWVLELVAP